MATDTETEEYTDQLELDFRAEEKANEFFVAADQWAAREILKDDRTFFDALYDRVNFSFAADPARLSAALKVVLPTGGVAKRPETKLQMIFGREQVRLAIHCDVLSLSLLRGLTWKAPPAGNFALQFVHLEKIIALQEILGRAGRYQRVDFQYNFQKKKLSMRFHKKDVDGNDFISTVIPFEAIVCENVVAMPRMENRIGQAIPQQLREGLKFVSISSKKMLTQGEYGSRATYEIPTINWSQNTLFCYTPHFTTWSEFAFGIDGKISISLKHITLLYGSLRHFIIDKMSVYDDGKTLTLSDGLLHLSLERETYRNGSDRILEALDKVSRDATDFVVDDSGILREFVGNARAIAPRYLDVAFALISVVPDGDRFRCELKTGWKAPMQGHVQVGDHVAAATQRAPSSWSVWVDSLPFCRAVLTFADAPLKIGVMREPTMMVVLEQVLNRVTHRALLVGVEAPPITSL